MSVASVLDVSWLSGAWLPGRRPAFRRPRNPFGRILRDASLSRSRYLDWIELNQSQSRLTILVCCMRPPLIMTLNRHTPCIIMLRAGCMLYGARSRIQISIDCPPCSSSYNMGYVFEPVVLVPEYGGLSSRGCLCEHENAIGMCLGTHMDAPSQSQQTASAGQH